MLQNVRKHRMYISKGFDLGLKWFLEFY
jgi:hypothetical protein